MTLIITPTGTQVAIAAIVYIISWVLLALYVRRWSKKTVKQIDHAHKAEQATLLEDDDIRWSELGIEFCERPFIKLR